MAGLGAASLVDAEPATGEAEPALHGLIGRMTAVAGQRDALISALLDGVSGMPGCLSYIVAKDLADADAIWITEVWETKQAHEAALSLVREAITRGRPMIAGFGPSYITAPAGGHGLGLPEV